MKRKDITKAAKELNEILGLDPQIDTKLDLDVVKKLILKASDLLEPEDKITKATKAIIAEIKEELGESAEPPEDKEEPEDTEEETSDTVPQDEDSDSDEEPPAKPESKKGKKSRQKTETVTKKSVILELLKSKKGATIEQMAQAIVDRGIDADYDKNCRVVKAHLQKMGFDTKKASIEANPIFKEV
jgi:hypothetical protein